MLRRWCRAGGAGCLPLLVLTACSAPATPRAAHPPASARAAPTSWVARENAAVGSPGWRLRHPAAHGEIEGWADQVSVPPGRPAGLHVSTTAPSFRVLAFRVGWYGGAGARLLWRSADLPGRRRPPPVLLPATRTVTTTWPRSLTVPTAGWSPGDYLLRLDAVTGPQSWVPLTLPTPSQQGRTVLLDAPTTWQAYNLYGGHDLYEGPGGDPSRRSYVVSFDRPYAGGDGAGLFLADELPAVRLAERLGLDLGYLAGPDVDADPAALRGARAVISLGHDEYWSPRMRTALTAARDAGTNLAFLGANAMFRRIRLEPSDIGRRRLEVNYRDPALDPVTARDPAQATSNWREPPRPLPESAVLGALYECNPVHAAMVVTAPGDWLWAGAPVPADRRLPGLVGSGRSTTATGPALPCPPCRCSPTPRSPAAACTAGRT
ncbi:MAG: N,N-dimethylformamidase beta subunit family domain-containing protein [Motilibacteraceae bacterium]